MNDISQLGIKKAINNQKLLILFFSKPKNFCFIIFDKEEPANQLLKKRTLNIKGHEVEVKKVTAKPETGGMPGGYGGYVGYEYGGYGGGYGGYGGYWTPF